MARGATARRGEAGAAQAARHRIALSDRLEPALVAGPAEARLKGSAAVIAMAVRAVRQEATEAVSPPVVAVAEPSPGAAVPDVVVGPVATVAGDAAAPVVSPSARDEAVPEDKLARRITVSVVASVLLHVAAVVLFAWASLNAPDRPADGEEGIPIELVASAEPAASAQQETASGRQDSQSQSVATEQRQAVEAPPSETPPEPAAAEPVETATAEPPVAQPDPVTTAQQILDQLPTPPMPDTLPILERAPEPPPVEAQPVTEPVQETPPPPMPEARPQPVHETPPQPVEDPTQRVETLQPSDIQAMVTPPVTEPPLPAPPQLAAVPPRPVAPPVVRREAPRERPVARPPPTRREAPTDASRTRPTRQTAVAPSPERPARAARQAESSAAAAPRGEGTGRQNRQAANGNAASGASNAAAVASYRQRAIAHVARFKVFPPAAQDRGIRGSVGFTFTVTRSGGISSVSVTGSSGAPMLDQATLAMVRRAVPFPPIPEGGPASMTISTRIGYTLH
jgi:protein TonB